MSIGGFKAVKLRATTNKSGQSGVIGSYAENAKDTLTRVKDAIVGFGGWTWNNDLSFVSTDGTETVQYITYYTTLTHTNGAQLFISYGAAGVQFHWSCFCQTAYVNGYASYPTITENSTTYTMTNGGGWRAGLCMSMIPPGSVNHYGTPNTTDNSWMPFDATPLCGYLGTLNETYKNAATVSTSARMTTGDEYIYIMAKDDLFVVLCHDPKWAGYSSTTGMGQLSYYGYIVGKLFENLADDDNQYYSAYGWLANAKQARITNNSYTDLYGFNGFYKTTTGVQPDTLFQNYYVVTSGSGQKEFGGLGFFDKYGNKYNQYGPDGLALCRPLSAVDVTFDNRYYNSPTKAPWYALRVYWSPINATYINSATNFVNEHSYFKGTIRTDLVRSYELVPNNEYRFRLPPLGTKFENGNFIMGPSMCAWGWNSDYSDAETEELCPWRQQSGFEYNSDVNFGGYNDTICSLASTGSKIFIAATDAGTGNAYFDSASLGGTTFDGAVAITPPVVGGTVQNIFYNSADSLLYLTLICYDGSAAPHYCVYQITPSTGAYSRIKNVTFSSYIDPIFGTQNMKQLPACLNKYGTLMTACTLVSSDYSSLQLEFRAEELSSSTSKISNKRNSTTHLIRGVCADNEGSFYIICTDMGTWSSTGIPSDNADKKLLLYKYQYDLANNTYTAQQTSGETGYVWKSMECGYGEAIVADNYGYIYLLYTTVSETGITQIGTVDMGVKKMRPDGTICWTRHLGVSGTTLSDLRAIYTYDNKIHFSGRISGGAFSGFSQTNTTDMFFGTMTTDGVFAVKYQGSNNSQDVINAICCEAGYDYMGVLKTYDPENYYKPKYALLKRTW